jgi:acyl-lipid omega-6 desaturase (Delta-12 desaturase)
MNQNITPNQETQLSWIQIVSQYNFPDAAKSWWQIINSVVPYVALWVLMAMSIQVSYLLTLFISIFAAGFMVRIFIIFHDCGHGSFFKSKRLNTIVGIITGLMVFTPYHRWHHDHHIHHNTVGNLDKRGVGDVDTLTVNEYLSLPKWRRFIYRFWRHPIFLFGIAPMLTFLIGQRLTKKHMSFKHQMFVHYTTLGVIAIALLLIWAMGFRAYLMIQIPVLFIAAGHGVWLFYVQHQYEHVVWEHNETWDYEQIALNGSSFFKLPRILQWFTGNIGFHHIHHLSPKIPNYKLEICHIENPRFQKVVPVTFFSSLRSLKLRLWDETNNRLIGFRELKLQVK